MMWGLALYVAAGSALGGATRFLLGLAIQQRAGGVFPIGTLVINVTGSLLLGVLLRYALGTPAISAEMRVFLTTGFCGGYTTFSTFSYETMALVEDGQYPRAALYIAASVIISLAATYVGFVAAREVLALRERI